MRTKAWLAVLGQMLILQRTSKTRRLVNILCALNSDISVGTSAIRVARVRSLSGRRRLPITRRSFLRPTPNKSCLSGRTASHEPA
jgi:hypothetical protein